MMMENTPINIDSINNNLEVGEYLKKIKAE